MNDTPTPETDAFMLRIDDSEIDLGIVKACMADMERQRDAARTALQAHFDHFREWSIPGPLYNQVQQALKGDAK